jgi:hypothetical protein
MMSDTNDPYEDGEVPADADFNPEIGEVVEALPGGGRLDEGEDEGLTREQVEPDGTALP